jgi:tRNA(fMet)-specific endonuclease VapC
MYTLDTNIIIYLMNGEEQVAAFLRDLFAQKHAIYVSTITETELFSYPHLHDAEAEHIGEFLSTVMVIPPDSRIARIAGTIRRTYGVEIADSVIAATALFTGSSILTRNVKDFAKVQGLNVVKL